MPRTIRIHGVPLTALVLLTLALTSAAASAAPASNGGAKIVGVPSGRCLDVTAGSTTPGARVQLYDCLGDPQQAWVWNAGQLQVYTGTVTLCLDAADNNGGANGSPVQVWTCTGKANQKWIPEADGTLRSAATGRCLDAVGGGTGNGTQLQIWDCLGDPQQQWVGAPNPNGGPPLIGAGSNRCVDVIGAAISPGSPVQLYDCLGDAQQQWLHVNHELQVYGGDCLQASGTTNGTPVVIAACDNSPAQQWSVNSDGTIRSLPSGLCLDAVDRGTANGTRLQIWTCLGGSNQAWSRTHPSAPSPAPAPAPAPAPVTTTAVPTPIPVAPPAVTHALRVKLILSWTWRHRSTRLTKLRIGRFPGGTVMSVRCAGRGCPRPRVMTARGQRAIVRLLRHLHGHRYRAGNVLTISLTAPGYRPERARLQIRDGRSPAVRPLKP